MMRILLPFILLAGLSASAQTSFTFSGKPIYEIDARRANASLGIITVELFPTIAPLHVRNFDSLVSTGFYDSTAFHRVIPGFMIQGGDPNSRSGPTNTWGYGDPSQPTVPAEFSKLKHVRGILSAARKGNDINSATSQFFICVATAASLDGNYSIYGRVLSGMSVVDTIVSAPRNTTNNMPFQKIEMFISRIASDDTLPESPQLTYPAYGARDLGSSVALKWQAVPGTVLYHVEFSTDSTFYTRIDSVSTTALQVTKNLLADSTIYYWRVAANNGGNYSYFSKGKFSTVGETTGIKPQHAGSGPSVFPNPGPGLFHFTNLKPGSTIGFYDLAGKLLQKEIAPGTILDADLSHLGKGAYLFRISSGEGEAREGRLIVR